MRLSPAQRVQFGRWLTKCGAEVLPPAGEWEIFRVVANGHTYSAYARKTGFQTWPTPLQLLYTQYRNGQAQQLGTADGPKKGMGSNRRSRIVRIAERDGWRCWYCGHHLQPLGYAEQAGARGATLEEVCPRQIGGPTHIGNQVIACGPCNQEAANFSVAQKVKIRDRKLAVRKQQRSPNIGTTTHGSTGSATNGKDTDPTGWGPVPETQIDDRRQAEPT